jgi:curved DNA-binding protein CbpA
MSSSRQPDLYAILGVDPAATAEQITHAYRDLLRRHHPDTRPTTPDIHDQAPTEDARLQQVIHAYAVLRDPAQRARYDRGRSPSPPTRLDQQHRNAPPPAGTVVIGTVDQPPPPWITLTDITPTQPTRSAPARLLELLLRDLFDEPR